MSAKPYIKVIIPLVIIQFSIIISAFWMLGDYDVKRFNEWLISEWMINYQAGFIRRGMIGNILHQFNFSDGVIPILYQLVFVFYCVYTLIFLLIYLLSGIQKTKILVLALLMPGGIFHMAVGVYFYTRKEILFLIHFGILCLVYMVLRGSQEKNKKVLITIFGLLAIIGGGFLTLVHEPYLFMAYPITLILCSIIYIENKEYIFAKFALISYGLLIPIIFVICSLNHGDQQMSQQIWDSYQLSDRLILAPKAPYTSALSTGALGWNLAEHLSTIYGVFITGTWFYWIFFWLMNGLAIFYIASKVDCLPTVSQKMGATRGAIELGQSTYVASIIFAYLVSSSMFLIASDYGRWISCATNLSLFFAFATYKSTYIAMVKKYISANVSNVIRNLSSMLTTKLVLVALIIYALIMQMPECCIRGSELFVPYDKFLYLFINQ